MNNNKKGIAKRAIALVLCAVMLFGAAPLSGIASLDFSRLGALNIDFSPIMSFFGQLADIRLPGLFGTRASADDATSGTCGDNLTWEFDSATGTLTISGSGAMEDYYGNAPWSGYTESIETVIISDHVTKIGDSAFFNYTELTSVTIGNGVTNIGISAFGDCTGLTEIAIPDSVTYINNSAFGGCPLENVKMGCGLTSIPDCLIAFETLKTFIIGSGVTSIDDYAFLNCMELTGITIPNSVTSIGEFAFAGCESLANFAIPDSVESIGDRAFVNCYKLTEVMIPDSVTNMGEYVFSWCSSLESVTIGNGITSIGEHAFGGCKSLANITIPDSVTTIGDWSFYNCTGLTSVSIGDSVVSIGDYAFYECSGLTEITIPDSVTTIGDWSFYNCTGLTSVSIGDNVVSIGDGAFYGCSGFTEITIPDSVTTIGDYAFFDCTGLTSVSIGDSVVSIGDLAFCRCSGLTEIAIPNSVKNIGENAFLNVNNIRYSDRMIAEGSPWGAKAVDAYIENGLYYYDDSKVVLLACAADVNGKVTVPDTVREVGDYCFTGADNVTEIVFGTEESTEFIDFSETSFSECDNLKTVTSPNTGTDGITYMLDEPVQYHEANKATSFAKARKMVQDDGVDFTEMNGILFCNRNKSGTYYVPSDITYICENAFANCKDLSVNLDSCNLRKIGRNAFLNSGNYNSWNKTGVFKIDKYIISAASSLSTYTVEATVGCIADGAFENCKDLSTVTFPENANLYIGKDAFEGTAFLEEKGYENGAKYAGTQLVKVDKNFSGAFTVKAGTKSIADGAFSHCAGLTSVTIPASVTHIGNNAFEYCTGLTSVILPADLVEIGNCAFRDCAGLTSVTIPASVKKIGEYAFMNCDSLTAFNIAANNEKYKAVDGVLFSKNGSSLIQYPAGKESFEELDINNISGCTRIESLAFRNCKNVDNVKASVKNKNNPDGYIDLGYRNPFAKSSALFNNGTEIIQDTCLVGWTDDAATSYAVPEGIKSIGANAFEGKTNLTSVTFNKELEKIGDSAFYGCTNLEKFVFTNSNVMQRIESKAFSGTKIKEDDIRNAVPSGCVISDDAFEPIEAVEENPTKDAVIKVKTSETVDYRANIKVIAYAENLPDGYYLAFYENGKQVSKGDNKEAVYPDPQKNKGNEYFQLKSDLTLTVKIVNKQGKVQKDADGNDLEEKIEIKVKTGFFNMIIAFFRMLFGLNKVTIKP